MKEVLHHTVTKWQASKKPVASKQDSKDRTRTSKLTSKQAGNTEQTALAHPSKHASRQASKQADKQASRKDSTDRTRASKLASKQHMERSLIHPSILDPEFHPIRQSRP